jgi:hypothetical protein
MGRVGALKFSFFPMQCTGFFLLYTYLYCIARRSLHRSLPTHLRAAVACCLPTGEEVGRVFGMTTVLREDELGAAAWLEAAAV